MLLKGDSGLVFVEWHYRWGDHWKRMTLARAKKEKRIIITCWKCKRPAAQLDHYWPYHVEECLCKIHQKKAPK